MLWQKLTSTEQVVVEAGHLESLNYEWSLSED